MEEGDKGHYPPGFPLPLPETAGWLEFVDAIRRSLSHSGIDIVCPISTAWYNSAVPEHLRLSPFSRRVQLNNQAEEVRVLEEAPFCASTDSSPPPLPPSPLPAVLGVLIANSKAIWPHFKQAYASSSMIRDSPHPLNKFVTDAISSALQQALSVLSSSASASSQHCALGQNSNGGDPFAAPSSSSSLAAELKWDTFWSHDTRPGRLVAIQRLAHVAGVAYLDDDSHLCVHPSFGPWFSLRAVVLFNVADQAQIGKESAVGSSLQKQSEGCGARTPPQQTLLPVPELLSDPLSPSTRERVKEAISAAIEFGMKAATHDDCAQSDEKRHIKHAIGNWKLWLRVRDTIQPNHPFRYSEDQILYHYVQDKNVLK